MHWVVPSLPERLELASDGHQAYQMGRLPGETSTVLALLAALEEDCPRAAHGGTHG
jgi:hypothetical protein